MLSNIRYPCRADGTPQIHFCAWKHASNRYFWYCLFSLKLTNLDYNQPYMQNVISARITTLALQLLMFPIVVLRWNVWLSMCGTPKPCESDILMLRQCTARSHWSCHRENLINLVPSFQTLILKGVICCMQNSDMSHYSFRGAV